MKIIAAHLRRCDPVRRIEQDEPVASNDLITTGGEFMARVASIALALFLVIGVILFVQYDEARVTTTD